MYRLWDKGSALYDLMPAHWPQLQPLTYEREPPAGGKGISLHYQVVSAILFIEVVSPYSRKSFLLIQAQPIALHLGAMVAV
jgi:hypothetical protein